MSLHSSKFDFICCIVIFIVHVSVCNSTYQALVDSSEKHESDSLTLNVLRSLGSNSEEPIKNVISFSNLVEYVIENENNSISKQLHVLDNDIVKFSFLKESNKSEPDINTYSSYRSHGDFKLKNEQTDIFVKLRFDGILMNKIFRIMLTSKQHNVVGYTLKLHMKKYSVYSLTSDKSSVDDRFRDIFFMEQEERAKIKSNVLSIPVYQLFTQNKGQNDLLPISNSLLSNEDKISKYRLNAFVLSDIVTSDGAPWRNLAIKIDLCPIECSNYIQSLKLSRSWIPSFKYSDEKLKETFFEENRLHKADEISYKLLKEIEINVFFKFLKLITETSIVIIIMLFLIKTVRQKMCTYETRSYEAADEIKFHKNSHH